MTVPLELRVVLGRFGIAAEAAEPGHFILRGDTLPHDRLLRAAGAAWQQGLQAWAIDGLCRLQALAVVLGETASPEERSSDDWSRPVEVPFVLREDTVPWGEAAGAGNAPGLQAVLARLRELPSAYWTTSELVEGLLCYAARDLDQPTGSALAGWLLERFGSLGAVLRLGPDRLVEHELFTAGRPDDRLRASLALLLQLADAILQQVLREQLKERPVIGSWTALIDYLAVAMQHEPVEHFRILFLDRKNILIRDEVQSRGTVDHTPLYPREVVKRALELAASAIIMVHNHPSGDPTPSQADIDMTRQVVAAATVFGIAVHDHIIVGKNRHTSFKTSRLI